MSFAQYDTYPTFWHTDLTFEDLRLGSLFITHMHVEIRNWMCMEACKLAVQSKG